MDSPQWLRRLQNHIVDMHHGNSLFGERRRRTKLGRVGLTAVEPIGYFRQVLMRIFRDHNREGARSRSKLHEDIQFG